MGDDAKAWHALLIENLEAILVLQEVELAGLRLVRPADLDYTNLVVFRGVGLSGFVCVGRSAGYVCELPGL